MMSELISFFKDERPGLSSKTFGGEQENAINIAK
jgi:hypothetical protein